MIDHRRVILAQLLSNQDAVQLHMAAASGGAGSWGGATGDFQGGLQVGSIMRLALPNDRLTGVGRRISVAVALSNDDGTVDVVASNGGEEFPNVPISMLEPMLPFEFSGISDGGTATLPPLEAAAVLKDRAGQLFRLKAY